MVDYKLLADSDPEGDLQVAFDSMAAETVTTTPETQVTYITLARDVGLTTANALASRLSTQLAWIDKAMSGEGIDVNNPQVGPFLDALVDTDFTQLMADNIKALGNVISPKYPGFKIGHLSNARQMRTDGRV